MVAVAGTRSGRLAAGSIILAGLATVALTLLVVPRTELPTTMYAGTTPSAALADATAGLALAIAGALAWLLWVQRPSVGVAAALAGVGWVAHDLVGWHGGPVVVRSLGTVLEPLLLPAILHLVIATLGPHALPRRARFGVLTAYLAASTVGIGRALFRDPFLDPTCWNNCRDNVFLLTSQPTVARHLGTLWRVLAVIVGVALVGLAVRHALRATLPARRLALSVLGPAAVLGAATLLYGVLRLDGRLERPTDALDAAVFQWRAWGAAALAAGVVVVSVRTWRTGNRLRDLTAQLADVAARGSLTSELAAATGDPSLVVAYPTGSDGRYTDAAGVPLTLPEATGRALTPIVRDGLELATVVHDPARIDAAQLRSALGPAALLALENERLQAALRLRLEELRASRARVVATADEERHRLERDLHDGAQQRLLALTYELRASRSLEPADTRSAALLDEATDAAMAAITDLRDLAHGIHPAILTESGLAAAVRLLADTAPVPVILDAITEARFPPPVERAAYSFAATAVDAAGCHDAEEARVRLTCEPDHLVLEVAGVRAVPERDLVHVTDRVGAAGGHVQVGPDRLVAELPVEVVDSHSTVAQDVGGSPVPRHRPRP
jgi:signal transduction histidine kinase